MFKGCLSCFRKKQSKKEDKPVKAEDVVELVAVKADDEEEIPEKKANIIRPFGYVEPEHVSTHVSTSRKNDFNKVKTFDLRGATKTKDK
ncbi:unnamed protein product [Microthlaspi erraticum]|uniref:Uncharacterized protein n=1 Tax=Microthlaspi erraticum TaxID=1685480 RepID=A0A6D2L8W2_9BRAS|nr:unnamed protein product [Microthlaspi erraticum]